MNLSNNYGTVQNKFKSYLLCKKTSYTCLFDGYDKYGIKHDDKNAMEFQKSKKPLKKFPVKSTVELNAYDKSKVCNYQYSRRAYHEPVFMPPVSNPGKGLYYDSSDRLPVILAKAPKTYNRPSIKKIQRNPIQMSDSAESLYYSVEYTNSIHRRNSSGSLLTNESQLSSTDYIFQSISSLESHISEKFGSSDCFNSPTHAVFALTLSRKLEKLRERSAQFDNDS